MEEGDFVPLFFYASLFSLDPFSFINTRVDGSFAVPVQRQYAWQYFAAHDYLLTPR